MLAILKKYKEIVLYLVFGVSTTVVNWIIYLIFTSGFHVEMTISNAVAWFGAVSFAFVTNKLFVFESRHTSLKLLFREIVTFFSARIFSGVFEIFLPTFLVSLGLQQTLFGIEGFWAKVVVSIIVIVLNYVLSKLIVFKKN